jgi:hypothetical protein
VETNSGRTIFLPSTLMAIVLLFVTAAQQLANAQTPSNAKHMLVSVAFKTNTPFGNSPPVSGPETAATNANPLFGAASVWNNLQVGYGSLDTNPAWTNLLDSTGAATAVNLSITGTIGAFDFWALYDPSTNDSLRSGYLFWNSNEANNSGFGPGESTTINWKLTGLPPSTTFDMCVYGTLADYTRSFDMTIQGVTQTVPTYLYSTAPAPGCVLFTNIMSDASGTISGVGAGQGENLDVANEANWSGFQIVGHAQAVVLNFSPTQTSAIATFNCTSGLTPCPDQGAHSMKFSVNSVLAPFSISLLATEVDGDGVCESGVPGDPTDPIDCRFVTFFGETVSGSTAVDVPFCYAYSSATPTGSKHCVTYSVQDAPPTPGQPGSPYTGPVLETIAWNTVETAPPGYINTPRMYDDPSDDANNCNCYPTIPGFPYSPEDDQFVFDITTFFNPNPGTVGTDPTTGGKTKTFNDFVIAFPLTLGMTQAPINSDGSSVFSASRGVVPIKFALVQDGVATCNLPPATISLSRLFGGTAGSIDESVYSMAADSGASFRIAGCQYLYNLDAKAVGAGQYKVGLVINSKVVGTAYFELK